MASKVTSQGSRATHNRSQRTVQTRFSVELWIMNDPEIDGFMTSFAQRFSRNTRLRIWYMFITTIPKKFVS